MPSPMFPDHDQWLAPHHLLQMWHGFEVTLQLTAIAVVLSTLLGLVLAAARSSGNAGFRLTAAAYTSLFRNTPLLVQLLFWYFGVPALFPEGWMEWFTASDHPLALTDAFTLPWPSFEFLAAMVGVVLYSTAYVSEEIRAGIRGVPHGQTQAAAALGLTHAQVLRHIVLPQAVRIALPTLLGQYMNILKNTSLTMAIGVAELSYTARQVEAESFRTFQAFAVATMLYVAAIAVIESIGLWRLHTRLMPGGTGRR